MVGEVQEGPAQPMEAPAAMAAERRELPAETRATVGPLEPRAEARERAGVEATTGAAPRVQVVRVAREEWGA
jgi:hypothetical protein